MTTQAQKTGDYPHVYNDSELEVDHVPEVPGNMLKNGNLAENHNGWNFIHDGASIAHKPYAVEFNIVQNMADWQQSMHQIVEAIETGTSYLISFDVLTTVDRTVIFGFDGSRDYTSPTIPAGVKTTINCEVTARSKQFMIYLGTDVGEHTVEISNISLLEKPVDLPNDINDELPEPITSLDGLALDKMSLLKNGNFTKGSTGMNDWSTYAVDWMNTWNVVKYTKIPSGMRVRLTNIGDGAGNIPEDAKFYQNVKMAAGKTYTISFDVYSEKARSIQISLDGRTNILRKTIGLQKGETRHVSFNVAAQSADTTATFSVLMGSVEGREVRENNLTFSNMKMEINSFTELAQLISDEDFSNGMGTFLTEGNAIFDADTEKSLAITVAEYGELDSITLKKEGLNLVANQAYEFSFVAGAKDDRTIKVLLEDGSGKILEEKTVNLTTDPVKYRMAYTPKNTIPSASFKILLGGNEGHIYLDALRMDIAGFAAMNGIDTSAHDIIALSRLDAPIFSEDSAEAVIGEDITI